MVTNALSQILKLNFVSHHEIKLEIVLHSVAVIIKNNLSVNIIIFFFICTCNL